MDIEISTISNKNAKNIIFILFSLAVVLLVIQYAVPANQSPVLNQKAETEVEEESKKNFVLVELSGTIILVNNELSFIRLVTPDEVTHSIGFDDNTQINLGEVRTSLEPFTRATVVASKLPNGYQETGKAYQYLAISIEVNGEIELRNESIELQDTAN